MDLTLSCLLLFGLLIYGASGNKFLFSNENKLVGSWWPPTIDKISTAKNSETNATLMARKMRRILPEFLNPEALQKYVPIMDGVAMQHLERDWSVLRLQPPAPGTFRQAITDLTYAGFKITKGWKKNGKLKVCIDFRNLNSATPKDQYAMHIVDMLVDSASKHTIMSFMVGNAGYNQIFIKDEDVHKTTFRCPGAIGTFEWLVMPLV
ncbi:hypothetical protein RJ640_009202 [Escallonia rubra]|uniref:Reverse transcriptase n=1 Tax=Escallonia rubra TaxID=112253 RepID=A0AA88U119_9ASTE|nr:hypothetical protein RJ640_009202 [Escallonia rubra]